VGSIDRMQGTQHLVPAPPVSRPRQSYMLSKWRTTQTAQQADTPLPLFHQLTLIDWRCSANSVPASPAIAHSVAASDSFMMRTELGFVFLCLLFLTALKIPFYNSVVRLFVCEINYCTDCWFRDTKASKPSSH